MMKRLDDSTDKLKMCMVACVGCGCMNNEEN